MSVAGRVAVLTGGAGGIGRCLAERWVARGGRLLLTDVAEPPLATLRQERGWREEQVALRALDVRDASAWEAALDAAQERWGRLDLLLNVAGVLQAGRLLDMSAERVALHLDVNVKGVILGTQAAARRMVAAGGGQVINVGSLAGLAPIPGLAVYSASKYAVRAFSLAAGRELAPLGVDVTVVCPDAVATTMLTSQVGVDEAALTFSGRILSPEEVAEAILGPGLTRRPRELWLPRSRGALARLADLWPGAGFRLLGPLERLGRARQAARRGRTPGR